MANKILITDVDEVDGDVVSAPHRCGDGVDERGGVGEVLDDVLADDQPGVVVESRRVGPRLDPDAGVGRGVGGVVARVEAEAGVVAEVAQHAEEVTAAAADLHDLAAPHPVGLHQVPGQGLGVLLEAGREVQRVVVRGRVGDEGRIEGLVPHVAARRAHPQVDGPRRRRLGLRRAGPQGVAQRRHAGMAEDRLAVRRSADGADAPGGAGGRGHTATSSASTPSRASSAPISSR